MPAYLLVGPAAVLIGIVSIFFYMRGRATQNKSMYSSRRGQIERKVAAARQRTLAPRGRHDNRTTSTSLATMAPAAPSAPVYEAPAAPPRQAWEAPAAPAPAYAPPPAPEYAPPPPAPEYSPPPAPFAEPATPAPAPPAQPDWGTGAPGEAAWTPSPAPPPDLPAPPEPAAAPPAEPPSYPAGGGASWEIVGEPAPAAAAPEQVKGKKDKKDKGGDEQQQQQTGAAWTLASGDPAGANAEEGEEVVKRPSATMAVAQYAVLVVGLVMVLIGVLVMVANSKVT